MASKEIPLKQKRYYVKYDQAPFEEDMLHEFKGHKNLSIDELPRWAQDTKWEKGSRKSISRNLCGFLNTGMGGTVYCGIVDDGKILGLKLTQYQRDHVVGSMRDLMSRFSPQVPSERYRVKFVHVMGPTTKEEDRARMVNVDAKEMVDNEERKREHHFRTPRYCWCDIDSKARCENGVLVNDYVIELTIKPWDPDNPRNVGLGDLLNLVPIHANEEGKIYFRRQASLIQYNLPEIANLSLYDAKSRCDTIISGLKKEISLVKASIARKQREMGCPSSTSSTTIASSSSSSERLPSER